jgi:predicted transcriptional regulator
MRIDDYLEEHGLNANVLAIAAGLPYSTVYKILRGTHQPRLPTMQAISRATNGKVSTIEDFSMANRKKTKAEVNYTSSASMRMLSEESRHLRERCDGCRYFLKPSGCTLVEGSIAPGGWCKLFER